MKKICVVLLVGMAFFLAAVTESHAGAWTLDKGKTWVEIFSRFSYSKYCFDGDGNVSRWDNGGFQEIWDLEGKLEYGVTDGFNALLYVPYAWNTFKNDFVVHGPSPELKNEGFKEIQIGGKYRFLKDPVVAAAQLKFFIDTGNDRNKEPKLSEDGHAMELRAIVSKSFNVFDFPAYASIESGFMWRMKRSHETSKYANAVPVFFEVGISPHDRIMIKNEFDCQISIPGTGQVKDTYTYRFGPIISLLGKGFSGIYRGDEKSLNLELLYGFTFAGRGDRGVYKDASWPNSDDRIGKFHEFIAKVQMLF